ncbi:hypothetical protein PO878_03485 [Iamia majanohamensis]|uniref:CsbD family protein n=1 Tax=Iamia majanohamensis TaxID=467976 RepID=A0AAE9Y6U7_9ACTN|nr:hypothetical protein [Iamia majanohamensis]WCO67785.1 hypothetical protein PO878_03485 [Iamia majanohamensis]
MTDDDRGPGSGPARALEGAKGRLKEALGSLTRRRDLVSEGTAQQEKAEAQREVAAREAEAEAARAAADQAAAEAEARRAELPDDA